jgi:hypothetical protein
VVVSVGAREGSVTVVTVVPPPPPPLLLPPPPPVPPPPLVPPPPPEEVLLLEVCALRFGCSRVSVFWQLCKARLVALIMTSNAGLKIFFKLLSF